MPDDRRPRPEDVYRQTPSQAQANTELTQPGPPVAYRQVVQSPSLIDANNRRQAERDAQRQQGLDGIADLGGEAERKRQLDALPVNERRVAKATETLRRYKEGKSNLEKKIVANEQFWKLRHWEQCRGKKFTPATAWLWNVITSRHADCMDGIPEPNILPREQADKQEAQILSSIVPVLMKQNEFERTYSDVMWYKLKQGTGVYGVFWDSRKLRGLGDISVKKIDLLNCFWQPGVSDIQQSRNFFVVELVDNEVLEQQYPQLAGKLASPTLTLTKYRYDDHVDTTDKSAVIDWYYKTNQNGREVLHYCKYVNTEVLFASENMPKQYPNGWYDHGRFPFVFDPLFRIEGSPCGYGYTDICKDAQVQIDLINDAIVRNALQASRRRYFVRGDGNVNEEEYADFSRDFVHTYGNLGEDSIREIVVEPLNGMYESILQSKINELRETSGNSDAANGMAPAGVTAASAIAALQEAAGKLSRDILKCTYQAYEQVVYLVIELIRQFYDVKRQFRIIGQNGMEQFISYSNEGLKNVLQGNEGDLYGVDAGAREPTFDIDVVAAKATAYAKMSQNELAIQFYNLGFFNPQQADQSLACIDMMEFTGKTDVENKIREGQLLQQQLMQYEQMALQYAQMLGDMEAVQQIQTDMQATQAGQPAQGADASMMQTDILGQAVPKEHWQPARAREQAQAATQIG